VRGETLDRLPDLHERARRWHQALDLDELEFLISGGRYDDAKQALLRRLVGDGATTPTVPAGGAHAS
jgi:hypothetical protein